MQRLPAPPYEVAEDRVIETDVQKPVFQHQGVTLCRFHCPAGHARWRRENQIRDGHNLAFPDAVVEIRHQRSRPIFVDPNQVVYYNDGDCFHRRMVREDGDAANVFLFDARHVTEALKRYDPNVDERAGGPFPVGQRPGGAAYVTAPQAALYRCHAKLAP